GGYNGGGNGIGSAGAGGGGASDITDEYGTSLVDRVVMPFHTTHPTNDDSYFFSDTMSHAADAGDVIQVRVKNNSTNTSGAIYFTGMQAPNWSESYVVSFPMTASDSDYRVYTIPIGTHPNWRGTINRLRFDLANGPHIST
ncbi:hypothetical protein, partial [Paenibacillus sinopodophylli]|uniref:hypothetical protein n=1 Tax=Paenibacillus sinopodophylli TaxID=1837342 RepID=UPI00148735B2